MVTTAGWSHQTVVWVQWGAGGSLAWPWTDHSGPQPTSHWADPSWFSPSATAGGLALPVALLENCSLASPAPREQADAPAWGQVPREQWLSQSLYPTPSFLSQTFFLPEQPKTPFSPTLLVIRMEGSWIWKQSQSSNSISKTFQSNNTSLPCFKPWLLTA